MKSKNAKTPRSPRPLSLLLAALLGSIAIGACSISVADDELANFAENDANGAGGNTSTSVGAGGPEQDASIVVEPDPEMAAPVSNPHASLCGAGSCAIGGDECAQTETCRLSPAEGTAVSQCGLAGKSNEGVICNSAKDCAAGLGCAATPNGGGLCKTYCCGDAEACPDSTYCAAQPMTEDPEVKIPVCVPANNCQPLPLGACGDGLACAIVREDGTTHCIPAGEGKLNGPCPCADGFVCSKLTNQCRKLCRVGKDAEDCGGGATCQAGSSGFPEGYGACVGGSGS